MNLEEEIALNQFGQGVRSDELLAHFSQLDEPEKRGRFVDLYCQVGDLAFADSDIEQAMAECSLTVADPIYSYLNLNRLKAGFNKRMICIPDSANPPEGTLDNPYKLLLHLFRIDYQRRFAVEKDNQANWRYRDLSNPEIVQGILTHHQALVEEVYTNPSFRSEFSSIAKLWHEHDKVNAVRRQEPEPAHEKETHFNFISYDELVTAFTNEFDNKRIRAIELLRHSVANALSVQYRVAIEQANRVVLEVMERYMRETYNTGLF